MHFECLAMRIAKPPSSRFIMLGNHADSPVTRGNGFLLLHLMHGASAFAQACTNASRTMRPSSEEARMELEQLRQLVEVERCGTISAAAEELHITQPSLSRSIRRLERDLGQDLFDRGRNSVTLNEAGRLALTHAKRILADVRLMRNDFDELSKHERTIRVASVAPAPTWRLTALVVERFPGTILGPELMGEASV